MSSCINSCAPKFEHHYIVVEQRRVYQSPGTYYYLCRGCGHEKPIENACVIDMEHQHEYCNYRGCINGFYIIRCTHFGCESFLRIFNPESQNCTNEGKHYMDN
jgi:hypothetical protein